MTIPLTNEERGLSNRGIERGRPDVSPRAGLLQTPSAPATSAETTTLPIPSWPFGVPVSREIVANYVDNRTARLAVNAVIGRVVHSLDNGAAIYLPLKEFMPEIYNVVPILPVAESKATALEKVARITPAADMARLGLTPCAFYRDATGVILPTVLNLQTLPNVWPVFRQALKAEGQRALGWAKAFENILEWYTVSRIPIPSLRTVSALTVVEYTLLQEFIALLKSGGTKSIRIEGMLFADVRVYKEGAELVVRRFGIQHIAGEVGQGRIMQAAYERAAIEAGKQMGTKSVRVLMETPVNQSWLAYLTSQGYSMQQYLKPVGFTMMLTKVFQL